MMTRDVPHQVTLLAFGADGIVDAVETSNHFAYHFVRRWRRDAEVLSVAALRPGQSIVGSSLSARAIKVAPHAQ